MIAEHTLRLTKAEAKAFGAEVNDLVERWRERNAGRTGDRRTYQLFQVLQPASPERR
jgi:hypothetical protein